jgi:serine/threonine protein phosphatase 1
VPSKPRHQPAPLRTFVIGDVHGEVGLLRKLIARLEPQPSDRLIFLGDYVDRGEDSRAVIDYVLELREIFECICLKGNHEDMLLDYLEEDCARYGPLVFLFNGGVATLESYGATDAEDLRQKMPAEHLALLHALVERFEDEHYIYVHAGLAPEPALEEHFASHLWIRDSFIWSRKSFGKKVIFGHTPQPAPLVMANKIGLDTGAFYSGVLTALEIPGEIIHQVRK